MSTSTTLAAAPVNDTRAPAKGTILFNEIRAKDRTIRGVTYLGAVAAGHRAEVVSGKSIRLFGTCPAGVLQVDGPNGRKVGNEPFDYSRSFAVGDEVIVQSGNFAFFGTILEIGPAMITVTRTGKTARLTIATFDHLNWHRTVKGEKIEGGIWKD